jgi:Chaperone of endosialidase
MATLTPILGLSKPIVGADDDVWGNMWNQNADILDGLVKPVDLAPYLLKAGGTMTGPLILSANAVAALGAVPLQQMQTGLATKIGDAPNDGGYYARRNLAWEPSPGSAINQDAPSDGFAYGRRNASWDKTLRLAGGTMTGVIRGADGTTALPGYAFSGSAGTGMSYPGSDWLALSAGGSYVMTLKPDGSIAFNKAAISPKGNLMLGRNEPASIAASDPAQGGGILGCWHVMGTGLATNAYFDGTAFRRTSATMRPSWFTAYDGAFYLQNAAAGALDSTIALATMFTVDTVGNAAATGAVTAAGTVRSNGNRVLSYGADNPSLTMYNISAGGCNGFWNDVNNVTYWGACDGNGIPQTGHMSFNTSGDIWARRHVSAGGNFSTGGTVQGGWVYSTGDMQANGNLTVQGVAYGNSGRFISQMTGEPSFCMHRPGYYAAGMLLNGSNQIIFANMGGGGNWQATLATLDSAGNFWASAAVTGNYVHSTGSIDADVNITGQRIRAINGSMNVNGNFFVADNEAYRLQRESWSGNWVFYENNTWNFQVLTNGDTNSRSCSYAQNFFSYGSVNAGNSWDFHLAAGGSGRLLQYAPNWYLEWNSSSGQLSWMGGGGGWLMSQRTVDWLSWNATGPVGGIGGYQNYSDARGKTDIRETEIGLPEIMRMKPARFTRTIKPEQSTGRKFPDGRDMPDFIPRSEIGFIAQELQEALPEAVVEVADFVDGEARLMMTLDPIVAALVNAVKTLNGRLVKLEGRH